MHRTLVFAVALAGCTERTPPAPAAPSPAPAATDELAASCKRFPAKRGWIAGAAPDLPKNWPPPPADSLLCGSEHDEKQKRAVWAWFTTRKSATEVMEYYRAALLERSHTVTDIAEDDGGPGLEFGDVVNGGGTLFVSSRGTYSVRWQPR